MHIQLQRSDISVQCISLMLMNVVCMLSLLFLSSGMIESLDASKTVNRPFQ